MSKHREALEEVLMNLRSIDYPVTSHECIDGYIDDSIKIITLALKEE